MSLSERLAAARSGNYPNNHGDSVASDGMRLAEKRNRFETPGQNDELDTDVDSSDPLFGDYVDTGESSPILNELISETYGDEEPTAEVSDTVEPVESSVVISSSRLANLLRRTADGVESTSERIDDTKDRAKKKLRLFGRAALRASTASGEFVLGAGMLTAKKGLELADRADAALFDAADSAKDGVKNAYNTAADKTGDAIMNGFAAVESGMDKAGEKMISFKDGVKEKLVARKTAALARRQARREKWSNRATAVKESVSNGLDRSAELAMAAGAKLENGMDAVGTRMLNAQEAVSGKVERTKASVHTTRAAGRAALDAFQATQRVHAEQNQL